MYFIILKTNLKNLIKNQCTMARSPVPRNSFLKEIKD